MLIIKKYLVSCIFNITLCSVLGTASCLLGNSEIVFRDICGNETNLNLSTKEKIQREYSWLDESIYFKSLKNRQNKKQSVRNPIWVQEQLKGDQNLTEMTVQSEDGILLTCLYFDRGKKDLVVMGHGLGDVSYKMVLYTEMFRDCDVLVIGFRGHSLPAWYDLRPLKRLFNVDFNCSFGEKEHLDVFAAVAKIKSLKNYENIIGFGPCYGAFILAKAQGIKEANNEKLFDKLILYECWPDALALLEKYAKDPGLTINQQKHSCCANLAIFKNGHLQKILIWILQRPLGVDLNNYNLVSHLENIKNTPVLLLHATNDLIVLNEEFDIVFNSLATLNKLVVFFPCGHTRSHVREKEVFAYVCNEFIFNELVFS